MKKRFTEEPVLLMPDQSKPFQIKSDASKVVKGMILTQLNSNGDWHPIAFLSKTFTETERKYEIYNWELLGIIQALKEWRHYIQGSGHTTVVYSDHKNLTYFHTAQKLNDRQARWSLYLSGFHLKLIHLSGTKNVQSDALSRRPYYGTDKRIEEEDKIVLPDNLFISLLDRVAETNTEQEGTWLGHQECYWNFNGRRTNQFEKQPSRLEDWGNR
jgi:RNase H-like domain found in reverse transcriptase